MLGKKFSAVMFAVSLLPMLLILGSSPASAFQSTMTAPFAAMQEMDGIPLSETEIVNYSMTADVNFDVYVMTYDNYNKTLRNEAFGYVDSLSALNVTSVNIRGELSPGFYFLVVETHGAGTVTYYGLHLTPIANGGPIPWETIAVIVLTAAIASFVTFALMAAKIPKT
jgi:hypothetical protein